MNNLKKKTILSTISLFFQSGYAAGLGFIASLVLTILLSPEIFGIYFTVLSLIAILNYFSDVGLAASLIQKKEINDREVVTVFSAQQALIIIILIIGFFASPLIIGFYRLPDSGLYLYWALLLSFFLSSLKTIPSIFLERKIDFQKIVLVQIVENTIFYLTVIVLALMGCGLTSFTWGVIFRALIGVILIYRLSPWKIKFGIDFRILKHLLSFGVPFQASSFLALFKDDLLTLYLGRVLGFQSLGYIGWAKKWAEAPIRIIMDSLSRVLFPLFSRFQHDPGQIRKVVEKVLYYQSMVILPASFGLALVMGKMIEVIPRYSKWAPAMPFFYLFCVSSIFSSYSTPFINLLNGLGKVKVSLFFMIGWTVATWILTPFLTHYYGSFGFPITLVILSSSFILVIAKTKKIIPFLFLKNVFPFFLAAIIMTGIVYITQTLTSNSLISLLSSLATGIISYYIVLILLKINPFSEAKKLWTTSRQ